MARNAFIYNDVVFDAMSTSDSRKSWDHSFFPRLFHCSISPLSKFEHNMGCFHPFVGRGGWTKVGCI